MALNFLGAPVLLIMVVVLLIRLVAGPTPQARSYCRIALLFSGFFLLLAAAYLLHQTFSPAALEHRDDLSFSLILYGSVVVLFGFLALLLLSQPPRPRQ